MMFTVKYAGFLRAAVYRRILMSSAFGLITITIYIHGNNQPVYFNVIWLIYPEQVLVKCATCDK